MIYRTKAAADNRIATVYERPLSSSIASPAVLLAKLK